MSWSLTIGRFGATTLRVSSHIFPSPRLNRRQRLAEGGSPCCARQRAFYCAYLGLRRSPRIRPYPDGAALWDRDAGRDAAANWGSGAQGAYAGEAWPGTCRGGRRADGEAIAFFLFLVLGTIQPDYLERIDDPRVSLLARLAAANIFLVIFNMIPAFPMDGGRVLHALLAMKLGGARATQLAASLGQALAFALGFLGLVGSNPILIFIAIFVYMAAAGEARMSAFTEAARVLSVGDAMETRFNAIPVEASLADAVETLLATAQHEFPVVDAFGKPVGLLVREDILSTLKEHDRDASITTFMRAPVETIRPNASLAGILDKLREPQAGALAVTDPDFVSYLGDERCRNRRNHEP
jgi:CBS domain-containing protein